MATGDTGQCVPQEPRSGGVSEHFGAHFGGGGVVHDEREEVEQVRQHVLVLGGEVAQTQEEFVEFAVLVGRVRVLQNDQRIVQLVREQRVGVVQELKEEQCEAGSGSTSEGKIVSDVEVRKKAVVVVCVRCTFLSDLATS